MRKGAGGMTAQELLIPRYKVIADYPGSVYVVGEIISDDTNCIEFLEELDKYPHIFEKLNWWEQRTVEEMPKRLICKAIPETAHEIIEIEEWDMELLYGWRNKAERKCASLRSFNPKYGYFPAD